MVLQSLIDAHEQQSGPYPIYFYCSRDQAEKERSEPLQVMRCLLRQSSDLPGGPSLHSALRSRFDNRRRAGDVDLNEATDLLCQTTKDYPVTYLVVDALDECNRDLQDLIDALKQLLQASSSSIKIFLTSRGRPDIFGSLNEYPNLCIDASQNQGDIELYVDIKVDQAISCKSLLRYEKVTDDLRQDIKTCLKDGANGM